MEQENGKELPVQPGPGETVVVTANRDAIDHYNNGIVTTRCICCGGPVHATRDH